MIRLSIFMSWVWHGDLCVWYGNCYGMVWMVWYGMNGMVWYGHTMVWCMVWYEWCGMVIAMVWYEWYGMIWPYHGMVYGMVWMVWYDMAIPWHGIRYGIILLWSGGLYLAQVNPYGIHVESMESITNSRWNPWNECWLGPQPIHCSMDIMDSMELMAITFTMSLLF